MIYDIVIEPCEAQYNALIEYAFSRSDAIMLVFSVRKGSKIQGDTMRGIRKQLAKWRIKTRHNAQWPVTTSYDSNQNFTIDLYTPSSGIKDYLLTQKSLFAWGRNGLPGDIAFFQDHQCWLATCSHEEFGWIMLDEDPPKLVSSCLEKIANPNDVAYHENY